MCMMSLQSSLTFHFLRYLETFESPRKVYFQTQGSLYMSVEVALRTSILRGITDSLSFLSFQNPGFRNLHREISRIPDSKDFPKSAIRFTLHWGILWGFNLEKIDSLWQFLSRSVAKRTDRFSFGVQSELSSSFITVGGMICYLSMELKVRKKLSVTEKVPELLEKNWSSIKRRQLLLFLSADCITCSEFSLRKLDQLS